MGLQFFIGIIVGAGIAIIFLCLFLPQKKSFEYCPEDRFGLDKESYIHKLEILLGEIKLFLNTNFDCSHPDYEYRDKIFSMISEVLPIADKAKDPPPPEDLEGFSMSITAVDKASPVLEDLFKSLNNLKLNPDQLEIETIQESPLIEEWIPGVSPKEFKLAEKYLTFKYKPITNKTEK